MKKIISLIAALAIVFVLAGCNKEYEILGYNKLTSEFTVKKENGVIYTTDSIRISDTNIAKNRSWAGFEYYMTQETYDYWTKNNEEKLFTHEQLVIIFNELFDDIIDMQNAEHIRTEYDRDTMTTTVYVNNVVEEQFTVDEFIDSCLEYFDKGY